MPQLDKYGRPVNPTTSVGAGQGMSQGAGGTAGYGGAGGGYNPSQVGYEPGMSTPNLPTNSQQATDAARAAVMGLSASGPAAHGGNVSVASQMNGGSEPSYPTAGAGSSYSVDNQGRSSYTATPNLLPQQADLQRQQTSLEGEIAAAAAGKGNEYTQSQAAQREALGEKAFGSQFSTLQPYLTGGGGAPQVTMGGGSNGMSPQEQAARAAAFGRAKDQAGQTAVAGLASLRDEMAARGMQGSTVEQQGIGNQIAGAAGGVNNFTREQLINDLNRYAGIADETYQGNITQRGQDMQSRQALIGLLGRGISY